MRKELEKTYSPSVEGGIYRRWLEGGYFSTKIDKTKKPYTIGIPPPNVTGRLHGGHALDQTFQDILIRWKRMSGFNALWVPGTDHASIATEFKVAKKMMDEEGLIKSDVGRDGFLERVWQWTNEYGGIINEQLKKLGGSCDWERSQFTMGERLTKATTETFNRLYEKGYIYRAEKLVNWCPSCKTSISDAEVEHVEKNGFYWHMKYPLADGSGFVHFVTSRPETMLGDTAVAVNPDDERYKDIVGKTVILPIVNREIPIIADRYVDAAFGTGVVKITPAHDPNDFEVGVRHNLPRINVINDDGTINEQGGKYAGLDRYEARKQIIEEFKSLGLFIKEEPITNNVGEHDRCHTVIEPLLKLQWFVKMEEMAKPAVDALKTGELSFHPDRFGKIYMNWLDNIRDWCVSRRLWWGHRIPAWHCADCGHITVSRETPQSCGKCGGANIRQDEEVLDTWFTSALWPFAVFGWPDATDDLEWFYPTDVLVTAYEIIFFWVVRMVFSGYEQTGKAPFKDVVIHGIMRDALGRKMDKSLGNGIDPLEIIDKWGADCLRLTIIKGTALGSDMRFYEDRLEPSRNFLNKLWNAARFIMMNLGDEPVSKPPAERLDAADKWILSRVNRLAKEVDENLSNYNFDVAVTKTHDFVWDELCDWYIEMAKPRLYGDGGDNSKDVVRWVLRAVLINALKMLHPVAPFITEEIFTTIQDEEPTIMTSEFPVYDEEWNFEREEREIGDVKEAVRAVRNVRSEMNVPPSKRTKLIVSAENAASKERYERNKTYLTTLGYGDETVFADAPPEGKNVAVVAPGAVIYVPLAELIDVSKERERLAKEQTKLEKEVERVDMKLNNAGFTAKAPEAVVAEEREKRDKYASMLAQTIERLKYLE